MSTTVELPLQSKSVQIWSRMIRPESPTYSPETARAILQLDFAPEDQRRIAELSSKVGDGPMPPAEREELERYVEINDILILLQSKARLSLKKAGLQP